MREAPRKRFFRAADDGQIARSQPSQSQILAAVHGLSQPQAFRVASGLRLSPPTQAKLREFAGRVSPQDDNMIATLFEAISNVLKDSGRTEPTVESVGQGFFDCRYSRPADPALQQPIALFQIGDSSFNQTFVLPQVPAGHHVVMQCFRSNTVEWPSTLRVFVNHKQIKAPGQFRFPVMDLAVFRWGSEVRVYYDMDGSHYSLLVRCAQFISFADIVVKIQNERMVDDNVNEYGLSVYSPISGGLLKYPGRGVNCNHAECFDLKEFLKICSSSRSWNCPICGKPTHVEDLIASRQMGELLWQIQGQDEVRPGGIGFSQSDSELMVTVIESGSLGPEENLNLFPDDGFGWFE
jgi:hypothetical protein